MDKAHHRAGAAWKGRQASLAPMGAPSTCACGTESTEPGFVLCVRLGAVMNKREHAPGTPITRLASSSSAVSA